MRIIAKCPRCSDPAHLTEDAADKRVRCQGCGRLFKVPTLAQLEKAIKILKNARGTIYVDENGHIDG